MLILLLKQLKLDSQLNQGESKSTWPPMWNTMLPFLNAQAVGHLKSNACDWHVSGNIGRSLMKTSEISPFLICSALPHSIIPCFTFSIPPFASPPPCWVYLKGNKAGLLYWQKLTFMERGKWYRVNFLITKFEFQKSSRMQKFYSPTFLALSSNKVRI